MGFGRLAPIGNFDAAINEMQQFVVASLQASGALFYWIDGLQMRDVLLFGISAQSFRNYQNGMHTCDPLNVDRLVQGRKRVSTLQIDRGIVPRGDYDRYEAYLCESRIADVMDFVFWHEDRAFAGLGVFKTPAEQPFCGEQFELAQSMQRYIEFNLGGHPRVRRESLRRRLSQTYRLTEREIDVLQLIQFGCTNQDVAEQLGIALTTVKTHVTRIFEKIGVENRASIGSWVNQIN